MHIDLLGAVTNPIARGLAKGIMKGMASSWTIEHLRAEAERGSDLATLEAAMPKFVTSLRHMATKFPSLRELTYADLQGWVREANPLLAAQVKSEPKVEAWLKRAWASGIRGA